MGVTGLSNEMEERECATCVCVCMHRSHGPSINERECSISLSLDPRLSDTTWFTFQQNRKNARHGASHRRPARKAREAKAKPCAFLRGPREAEPGRETDALRESAHAVTEAQASRGLPPASRTPGRAGGAAESSPQAREPGTEGAGPGLSPEARERSVDAGGGRGGVRPSSVLRPSLRPPVASRAPARSAQGDPSRRHRAEAPQTLRPGRPEPSQADTQN